MGLNDAPDSEILDYCQADHRIVVSHDTDFGTLLAVCQLTNPSFILFRSADPLTADDVAHMLIDNLPTMAPDLEAGAIITFARRRLRSRRLPRPLAFRGRRSNRLPPKRTMRPGRRRRSLHAQRYAVRCSWRRV